MQGEKHQPIKMTDAPSKKNYERILFKTSISMLHLKKIMRGFYLRHPSLKRRSAECVDSGHIIMANKNTITDYFKLLLEILVKCDIVKLESSSGVMHESIKQERVYLADKKRMGCSVQTYKSLDAMEQRMFI